MEWFEWLALPFFVVGVGVVTFVVCLASVELVRAVRQALRIAYVVNRLSRKRGFRMKVWWKALLYDLTSAYSTLQIGHYRISRNPSVPIGRHRY